MFAFFAVGFGGITYLLEGGDIWWGVRRGLVFALGMTLFQAVRLRRAQPGFA
jgi:cyanate permease